jgi:predicted phosphohydrolase
MKVWAIGDPHLSCGIEGKKMDVFGSNWESHHLKIYDSCHRLVKDEDLLLIPGDISWALKTEDATKDLEFIASLPGTKIISKGNHDYWWPSNKRLQEILPNRVLSAQNCVVNLANYSIIGVRLWDTDEFNFDEIIDYKPNPKKNDKIQSTKEDNEKIFQKELVRLENSLKLLDQGKYKILLCHYPPIGLDLKDSRASKLIDQYKVDLCVFGHLHNVKNIPNLFGTKNQTRYVLTSCDYLDFTPIQVV